MTVMEGAVIRRIAAPMIGGIISSMILTASGNSGDLCSMEGRAGATATSGIPERDALARFGTVYTLYAEHTPGFVPKLGRLDPGPRAQHG